MTAGPATARGASIRPLYLEVEPDTVFGLFHPAQGARRRSAVLLCPPFGWAEACSYRARLEWAYHLAQRGHPTLRIDLPGTGDSAGDLGERDRVSSWTAAIVAAVDWLRVHEPDVPITVIGIELGGLLALLAVAAGAQIDELVLWGTRSKGSAWVRELRAMGSLETGPPRDAAAPEQQPLPDGAVSAGGFILAPETRAALEEIDVMALQLPSGVIQRALLLDRDGMAADERLGEALRAAGAAVSTRPGPGFGASVIGDLQTVEVPYATFEETSAWLDTVPATADPSHGSEQPERERLELDVHGARVREEPFVHDVRSGRLFGVLAEPGGPPADLCAVLLNAGPQRRTGPNRMWVQSARRWAARGVPSLRIDLDGIGDADGRPAGWREEAAFYEPQHVEYVKDVLARLRTDGFGQRFILLGLCSGANWAFNAALDDESVVAALLINPRALLWKPWIETDRETRKLRKLASPEMWGRFLRGDVEAAPVAQAVRAASTRLRRAPAEALDRVRRRGTPDELDAALAHLAEQGTSVTIIFTDQEPLYDELSRAGHLEDGSGLQVENVHTGDNAHALQPPWVQAEVHQLMDDVVERELGHRRPRDDVPR